MSEEPTPHRPGQGGPDSGDEARVGADAQPAQPARPAGPAEGAGLADDPQQPRQPWPAGYEFGREDGICAALIGVMTLYGLAMIPLRPVVLGLAPIVLVALTGSMTGLVMVGALGATGAAPWWPAAIVIGALSAIKFDLVWWWAGKLWGDHFIASIAGQTERARRRARRAEQLTRRYDILALGLGNMPFVPVPRSIVCAVLGAAGTRLWRVVAIDVAFAAFFAALFVALGWRIGEPAVAALEAFGKYMWYVSIGLLVVVFYVAFRNAKKQGAQAGA